MADTPDNTRNRLEKIIDAADKPDAGHNVHLLYGEAEEQFQAVIDAVQKLNPKELVGLTLSYSKFDPNNAKNEKGEVDILINHIIAGADPHALAHMHISQGVRLAAMFAALEGPDKNTAVH